MEIPNTIIIHHIPINIAVPILKSLLHCANIVTRALMSFNRHTFSNSSGNKSYISVRNFTFTQRSPSHYDRPFLSFSEMLVPSLSRVVSWHAARFLIELCIHTFWYPMNENVRSRIECTRQKVTLSGSITATIFFLAHPHFISLSPRDWDLCRRHAHTPAFVSHCPIHSRLAWSWTASTRILLRFIARLF